MAGSPDLAPILELLNATRASARERQGEIERKIRAEARKLRQGDAAGQCSMPTAEVPHITMPSACSAYIRGQLLYICHDCVPALPHDC